MSLYKKEEGGKRHWVRIVVILVILAILIAALAVWWVQAEKVRKLTDTARGALAEGRFEEAVTAYEQVLTYQKDNTTLMAELGKAYFETGRWASAREQFETVLTRDSGMAASRRENFLYYIGECSLHLGEEDPALDAYSRILELSKDPVQTGLDLYEMLIPAGFPSAGQAILEQVMDTYVSQASSGSDLWSSRDGTMLSQIGEAWLYLGDDKQAEQAFLAAISAGYEEARVGLAKLYRSRGDLESLRQQCVIYLDAHQDNAFMFNEYGLYLMSEEKYEEALEAFAAGLALTESDPDGSEETLVRGLMFNEASVLEYLGEWQKAYEKMLIYTQRWPEDEEAAHELVFLKGTITQ